MQSSGVILAVGGRDPKRVLVFGSSSGFSRRVPQRRVSTVRSLLLRPQTNLRCYISSFCSVGRIVESQAISLR